MEKNIESLQKIAEKLFSLMATKATVEVVYDKANEAYVVNVEAGDETGLLIGKKGETLGSIQAMLGILFKQKTDEWNRVVVNVGDYREKEEDYLRNLATTTAERAKETKEPQSLYNLTPGQRRIVHMTLSEDEEIETESMGDGEERYLVVKSKK